jgi:hypothetical protein
MTPFNAARQGIFLLHPGKWHGDLQGASAAAPSLLLHCAR